MVVRWKYKTSPKIRTRTFKPGQIGSANAFMRELQKDTQLEWAKVDRKDTSKAYGELQLL